MAPRSTDGAQRSPCFGSCIARGSTRFHVRADSSASTAPPAPVTSATVMRMCGRVGVFSPVCARCRPPGSLELISNRPEMNWEEPDESMLTCAWAARQGCRRRNSERQTANLAVVINRCTQLFQTVKHRLHRACISLLRRAVQNSLGHLQTGQGRARNASPCRPVRRARLTLPWNRPDTGGVTVTVVSVAENPRRSGHRGLQCARRKVPCSRERSRPIRVTGLLPRAARIR